MIRFAAHKKTVRDLELFEHTQPELERDHRAIRPAANRLSNPASTGKSIFRTKEKQKLVKFLRNQIFYAESRASSSFPFSINGLCLSSVIDLAIELAAKVNLHFRRFCLEEFEGLFVRSISLRRKSPTSVVNKNGRH